MDILANYLFRLSQKDKLNVRFQMDGMDGKLTLPFTNGEKWNAFYYRTRANVDYTHQFNKLDLNIAGNFGLSNFNFQPESVNSKQKFTSGDFHAGIHFTDETAPLRFNAETNLLMYERQHNMFNESEANTGIKETIIRTKGDVTGAIGDQQLITIALEMNNLLYNGYTKNVSTGDEYFKNYTTLLLNPYYELDNDDWKLHIGANVDLSFGFDKSFRISPDITAQYIFSDSYIVYAKATGGKQLNDFRRLESICPYGELPEANTTATLGYVQRPYDTYEQINGSIGFKASPYPGLWFNVFGGYQNLKNDLSYLGFDPSNIHSGSYLSFAQDNTENLYLGGEISYDYKDILGISAKYTYRNWDSKTEEYLLAVKPVSEMSFNVRIHPISALNINLGYDYINRKEVKDHGDKGILLGSPIQDKDRVVIIEDVTTAGTSIQETLPIIRAQGDVTPVGLVVSVDRMERGQGTKSALKEIEEKYGLQTTAIVTMAEVVEHLYNREYQGRVVIDDAMKEAIDRYYEQYGAE